ncbi:FtsB family cell division protein [Dinghuibacter silviterrae]|uniref:Septum formation initiator n=1 Tax=Dinghuibacter silviterrae TaxID=1539049 RepID=A0A4R8DNC7_9BACT|nr:septum formation initiator family protein [Dinghuibacter silviterrae]TDW99539.1 septum formation initiator [Dinghuibacter silviterrae]
MLKRIPKWLKNRYLLTTAAFVLWVSFFDRNDLFTQGERARDLRTLQKSKTYYTTQIEAAKRELDQMTHDPSALEKFAREKYRMKKDNEDEFTIDDAPSKNAQ